MSARHPYSSIGRLGAAVTLGTTFSLAVAGCSFGPPAPDPAGAPPSFPTPSVTPTRAGTAQHITATTLVKGLRVPWGVAFLPDGGALVTERDTARILKVGPESTSQGPAVAVVKTLGDVDTSGEGGLLGIAVSPEYDRDQAIFVYYSTRRDNRIARLTLGGEPTPIVTDIPRSGTNSGGRLGFGPDGYLYASTADTSDQAQDVKSLGGKILRMTSEGKPAPGNPYPGSLVWSLGHRDVRGFAWDAGKRMYATEAGQKTWDEINLIGRGRNYGWPRTEGQSNTDSRFINPIVQWPIADASCAGAEMVDRVLVTACLDGERIWLVELTANGGVLGQPRALLSGQYGRLRTVTAAPDGSIWLTTSNHDGRGRPRPEDDQILRLVFAGGGAGRS